MTVERGKLPWGIVMMGWEEQSQTQGAQEEDEEDVKEKKTLLRGILKN